MRRMAHDGVRHSPETGRFELFGTPAIEFGGDLVPPGCICTRTTQNHRHVVEAEGEQNRLLEPLIDDPVAAILFGHAKCAAVELRKGGFDGIAIRTPGFRREGFAVVPGRFNGRLQVACAHGPVLCIT